MSHCCQPKGETAGGGSSVSIAKQPPLQKGVRWKNSSDMGKKHSAEEDEVKSIAKNPSVLIISKIYNLMS